MSRQYNRRNQLSRTFKDYLVPIIGFVLICILVYSFLGWGTDTASTETLENRIWYSLQFSGIDTEAFIEYTWGNKEEIENSTEIFKWEKLIVKEGSVSFNLWTQTQINVDKIGEVKLNEDGSLSFFSSNMWLSSESPIQVDMRYASVKTTGNSVLSLSQNEVGSTIYVLSGTAEVSNLANQSTLIGKWQKITVARVDASKEDIDLSLGKSDIDNYFINSDWFLENNGASILDQSDGTEESWSWSTSTSTVSGSSLIKITNLDDESTVTTDSIDISGSFTNSRVSRIIADGKVADINEEEKTFQIKWVSTDDAENDIIIKIYNWENELLSKQVYTVYYTSWTAPNTSGPTFKVENYSLDATEFQFISPKSNPYTTTATVVMIEWRVPAGIVQKITINDYELRKFPQYGSYWAYFANQEFWNLKEGLNVYKVEYVWNDGSILHSNAFTIIKEEPTPTSSSSGGGASEWTISDEATPTS